MATTTKTRITVTEIDFDTRLALTVAGMNVLIDRHDMSETRAAVAKAELAPILPEPKPGHPVLEAAADIIRQRGWTRGEYTNAEGQVCAVQAIRQAAGYPLAVNGAVNVLLDRIAADVGHDRYTVQLWNDSQPGVDAVLRLMY